MSISNKYYVLCNDSFMSGWGNAKGKTNVLCFEFDNFSDAEKMQIWIKNNRSEMKHVRINISKPKVKDNWYFQIKTRPDMPKWYMSAGIKI